MLALTLAAILAAAPDNVAHGTLMNAVRDEVARAKENLALPGMDRPYYILIAVEDEDHRSLMASFGALGREARRRVRTLRAQVRVGDPSLDNTNFISLHLFDSGRMRPVPIEDDYDALRRVVWLAIDGAYKEALQALAKKRAALKTQSLPESHVGDLAPAPATKTFAPRPGVGLDAAMAERMKRLSRVFQTYREVQDSRVELTAVVDERYLVDSDGTEAYDSLSLARLRVVATTQAEDGMHLSRSADAWAPSPAEFPEDRVLESTTRRVADELVALRRAPVIDDYTGPVLFEGQAAPQLAMELLSGRLGGTPPPLAENPAYSAGFQDTDLARRIGQKVIGNGITVEDDPLRTRASGQLLAGAYRVDDEGVPAEKVPLIRDGTLQGFLMSRTPRKGFTRSNGHGRTAWGDAQATVGVLVVRAEKRGEDAKALRAQLLKLARAQGLDHAYIVRAVSDGSERSPSDLTMLSVFAGGEAQQSRPGLLYRIRVGGKEELVRGAQLQALPLRALRDIVAVGRDEIVFNQLGVGGRGRLASLFPMFQRSGFLEGVPMSCVSPALLFSTVELVRAKAGDDRVPYLPHPFFLSR